MSSNPETPLLSLIKTRLGEAGSMSVADYMALALDHPDFGYYRTADPFGETGDFVTAPEISQMFGELLGLWLATAWQEAGRPAPFRLVELGPGRGQLMADLIRATAKVPGFLDHAELHLVESSERLRGLQRQTLPDVFVRWHEDFEDVPNGPLFLIANEFLDALPVHQLIKVGKQWEERVVTLAEKGALGFSSKPASDDLVAMIAGTDRTAEGDIAEVSPTRSRLARQIGERLVKYGGVAALIDYGAWIDRPTGDTLQAVSRHQAVNPLSAPGQVDITTQVDFRAIGETARQAGAAVFGPVPQGPFLRALGIEPRTMALLNHAGEDQRQAVRSALFRLTDASAMGEVFKVLVLAAPDGPAPPGFQAPTDEDRKSHADR